MKTLYLDIFSGLSGDMFMGALLDLGVDLGQLEAQLRLLPVSGYRLEVSRRHKSSIEGVKFDVHLEGELKPGIGLFQAAPQARPGATPRVLSAQGETHAHGHGEEERTFGTIGQLIEQSGLSPWVKEKAIAIFYRVAVAEGKIHGMPPEAVHFHEVGAVDSIVDIVGACIGLELLGRPRVWASPVVEGTGWVRCAHGRFPVPTAATLEILGARGIAITQCEEPHELVTPTGAALLAELVERFGLMQGLVASRVGYGLGTRDNKTRPNVVRAILGEVPEPNIPVTRDWEWDSVAVLETNLDDLNPELLGIFMERALAAGALDVFHTPVQMKKNRPGTVLTVLCETDEADRFSEQMLRETSAFGVRRTVRERRKLRREFTTVNTSLGEVTVKLGRLNGELLQASPEFESCKKLAEKKGVPVKAVYEAALRALPKEEK